MPLLGLQATLPAYTCVYHTPDVMQHDAASTDGLELSRQISLQDTHIKSRSGAEAIVTIET
jgi:hypothetical protein